MLDKSINKSTDSSSNWFVAGAKAFLKEASYQTLDVISFGALHRQDKLADQKLSGRISDAEYHAKTGVNVVLSGAQAALTLGTGGVTGTTAGRAIAWGAAGGVVGQGLSDVGEIYGTQTKSIDDVRATDYMLAGAMGAAGGYAGYKSRPGSPGPSNNPSPAEHAGVIAEHGQSVTPDAPAPAKLAASAADVNVHPAVQPSAQVVAASQAADAGAVAPNRAPRPGEPFIGPTTPEYNIAPHRQQPKPSRPYASHHGIQQKDLQTNVPGYAPNADSTIMLHDRAGMAHRKITGEQATQRAQVRR